MIRSTKHGRTNTPDFMPDPYEPVNRGLWAVNQGILVGVMQPTSRVYRTVVPTRARQSITDFTRNITYPGRVVNNMLQNRWQGAGDESLRFLTNTTVGIAGLFDVATAWNIPKSDANFGQTFVRWGWKPNSYLMLPLLGPSDFPHAFGTGADELSEPWNYKFPYRYASYGTTYNNLSGYTEGAVQFIRTESDPYVGVKDIWTYASKEFDPNMETSGPKDPATLQTLGVALIKPQDPDFRLKSRILSVRLPSTGKNMKCNYWLQKSNAPLVYVSPGMGLHRESSTTLALAEQIYQAGYSVVTTTGVFHPEFMENASTADIPAYPPNDCHDLLVEFTEFDKALEKKFPGKFGKRALVGFSMGGFQALYLAAREKQIATNLIHFDRYVAINTPVDFQYGTKAIDSLLNAANAWPANERQDRVNNAAHKVAGLALMKPEMMAAPPFNAIESKFLVGLSFKLTLRDTIFSSQLRHNMGILETPLSKWKRAPSYNEIMQFSFRDYFVDFALPYYKQRGISTTQFSREVNLRTYQSQLRANSKIRVLINRNDFILSSSDVAWMGAIIPSSRIKIFPSGGHLGNLTSVLVRSAISNALDGLK